MKKKSIKLIVQLALVSTALLSISNIQQNKIVDKQYNVVLANNITGNNITQEINNNYLKNSVQLNPNPSIGQVMVDMYTAMSLKEGAPKDLNKISSMYYNAPQTYGMTPSERMEYVYLLAQGVISPDVPNNLNQPISSNLVSQWYNRLINKSDRINNLNNPNIVNGYTKTKIKVVKTDSPPVISTVSIKENNKEITVGGRDWSQAPSLNFNGQWKPGMKYNQTTQTSLFDFAANVYHKFKAWYTTETNGDTQDGTNYKNNTSTVKGDLNSAGANDALNNSINGSTESFTITRVFDTNKGNGNQITKYYLYGHPLNKDFVKDNPECKEVKSVTADKDGNFTVVFDVTGVSAQQVIANLNAITSYVDTNGALQSTYIPGYTQVTQGGNSVDYVSASTFRTFNNEIQVIKGKFLRNQLTGAEAVLLDNSKECLIGNEVYHFDSPTTITIGNELYYNLAIVDKLLSNSYLGNITGQSTVYYYPSLTKQTIYKVNNSTGNLIQNAIVQNIKGIQEYNKGEATPTMYNKELPIVNLTQLNKAVDTTIYPYSSTATGNITLIINWTVELPSSIKEKISKQAKGDTSKGMTLSQLNSTYYAIPTDPNLKEFWNTNLAMDNALANMIYGTQKQTYFGCGYLVPKITILSQNKLTNEQMYNLLGAMGIPNANSYFNTAQASLSQVNNSDSELAAARTLTNAPAGNKIGKLTQYGSEYLEGENGIVYQTLQTPVYNGKTDGSEKLEVTNKSFQSVDVAKKTITLASSEGTDVKPVKATPKVGQTVSLYGTNYIYQGEQVDPADGKKYIALLYSNPLKGVVSFKDNKPTFYIGQTLGGKPTNDTDFTTWDEKTLLQGHLDAISNGSIVIPSGLPNELPYTGVTSGLTYVNGHLVKDFDPSKSKASDYSLGGTLTPEEQKQEQELIKSLKGKDQTAQAYDVILLNTADFSAYQQPKEKNSPIIFATKDMINNIHSLSILPNFFNRGLNQGVIDSIIGHCYGYVSQARIPQGSRVLIGNTYFTEYNGNLISDPMSSLANLVNGKDVTKLKGAIASQFSGISIQNGMGKTSSLDTYITSAKLGMEVPTMNYSQYKGNILLSNNGQLEVYDPQVKPINMQAVMNNNPYGIGVSPYNTQTISSVIVAVQFAPEIKFMQISPGYYTLVYYTNEEGPGIMNNEQLFNNNLDGPDFDMFIQFGKSTFMKLGNASELIQDYKNHIAQNQQSQIAQLLETLLIIYLSWAWVGVFIVYCLKKSQIFDDLLLEKIRQKREDGKKPIDWYLIASAFILSAEEDVTFVKFVICQFIITLLLFLAWDFIMFGKIFLPV